MSNGKLFIEIFPTLYFHTIPPSQTLVDRPPSLSFHFGLLCFAKFT
jgi:hypothetical protein